MRDKENSTDKTEQAPVDPPVLAIFVSNDENHSIELEPSMIAVRNGLPERIEGSRIQFQDRVLRVPVSATITMKGSGKKVNIAEFLRSYHRNNIDYREASNLDDVNSKGVPYIDKLSGMSYEQVRAEAARAGVRIVEGDSKEKIILDILRNKKEG